MLAIYEKIPQPGVNIVAFPDTDSWSQWFEFQLYFKKAGDSMSELTNNKFFALSGGEKAMAMYIPLFSYTDPS